jgi:hypothetical protein
MKEVFFQFKMLFSSPRFAVSNPPSVGGSLLAGVIILLISFPLLLVGSLSSSTVSISVFPPYTLSPISAFAFAVLTQLMCICVPFFITYGVDGARSYLSNFAIIQLPGFGLALVGFLYQEIFWHLYRILPISGLTANAIYEAVLLLYPALVIVLFRYILIWKVATDIDQSPCRLFILIISHLGLSGLMWYLGGLI